MKPRRGNSFFFHSNRCKHEVSCILTNAYCDNLVKISMWVYFKWHLLLKTHFFAEKMKSRRSSNGHYNNKYIFCRVFMKYLHMHVYFMLFFSGVFTILSAEVKSAEIWRDWHFWRLLYSFGLSLNMKGPFLWISLCMMSRFYFLKVLYSQCQEKDINLDAKFENISSKSVKWDLNKPLVYLWTKFK